MPADAVIAETRARSTPDNALSTAAIALCLGLTGPIVVNSRSHKCLGARLRVVVASPAAAPRARPRLDRRPGADADAQQAP